MTGHRLLLADDHAIVIEGLRRILEPHFQVVGLVQDGAALVTAARALRPDLIVADISMPLINGIDAARQIRKFDPKVKIVFLTMHPDVAYAAEALAVGASGYVLKISAGEELLHALAEAIAGRTYVTPSIRAAVNRAAVIRPEGISASQVELTTRQREVLQLLAEGKSPKDIAGRLNISVRTVEFHKYQLMKQLGIRTNAELTRHAVKLGITPL